jgi:SAM-dependent methyltransferase
MVCEHQRHYGVVNGQHLTPDAVAVKMAWLARWHSPEAMQVLDACCGTGQITKELLKHGFRVSAFDNDVTMTEIHQYLYPTCYAAIVDFREFKGVQVPLIVACPPSDEEVLAEFMAWLVESLTPGGRAVLLLPDRYVDEEEPEELAANLSRLKIRERSMPVEKFAHTDAAFEIVVVEKRAE